jgi:Ca2+-binding RTX toxin-like protein
MAIRNVPGTYATISAAVAAAQAGDTVKVAVGYAGNEFVSVGIENLKFDIPPGVPGIYLTAADGVKRVSLVGNSSAGINGNEAANVLKGDAGANFLYGNGGADSLSGGDGADVLVGGSGNDALDGGGGLDRVSYVDASVGVVVDLQAGTASDGEGGTDTLTSVEMVDGSRFADTIILSNAGGGHAHGYGGNDKLKGGTAGDTLYGGSGNDTIDGGAGIDAASYYEDPYDSAGAPTHGATVNLLTGKATDNWGGKDTLTGIENLYGSSFDDTFTGDGNDNYLGGASGDDKLAGGAGNDSLDGGDGDDTVNGGAGNDNLFGGSGNDTLDGSAGDDGINGGGGKDTVAGGDGNDWLSGGSGSDAIDGGAGIDWATYYEDPFDSAGAPTQGATANLLTGTATDGWGNKDTLAGIENLWGSSFADSFTGDNNSNSLTGNAGNDTLDGGAGNDNLNGGDGKDTLLGGDGDDYVTGNAGNDAIQGGAGNDSLHGDDGRDTLVGGDGNDYLFGGAGNDSIDGGAGVDVAFYEDATAGVVVDLLAGTASDGLGGTDSLTGVESVNAGRFADKVTLSNFNGGWVFGRAGNDKLTGGTASDTIFGGSGNDTIDGGAGIDTANYRDDAFDGAGASTHGVTASLTTGKATDNWGNKDTLIGIENLGGSAFADTLTGDGNRNILRGEAGDDELDGRGGNDDLYGGDGNDTLIGGDGIDYFQSSAGNDTYDGGVGYDFAWWARALDFDTVDYRFGPTAGVTVDLAAGTASDGQGGTDTLVNIEQVYGSAFNDTLKGGGEARFQSFRGGAGNDTIIGSGKVNTRADYTDSTGGVTIKLSDAANGQGKVTGGSTGTDTVRYVNQFFGSNYADTYDASAYILSMPFAGNGFNVFRGGAGNDTIIGNGNTRLDFGNSASGISIDLGLTTVADGLGGVDTFSGVNSVVGSSFADNMVGTGASETFTAAGGNDVIDGGGGFDEARYDGGTNPITMGIKVNMKAGTVTGDPIYVGDDTLKNIEGVRGSLLDDTYVATGYASGGTKDTFRDGPVVNRNYNRFAGVSGNDKITGNGQTALDYRGASAGVSVTFTAQGKGKAVGVTEGTDTFTGVFSILDSVFDDVLTGSDATADGYWEGFSLSAGNDVVTGGGGNDYISYSSFSNAAIKATFSGEGAGKVTGNGTDTFTGIEYLIGSLGDDRMTGAAGNETFAGIAGDDKMAGGAGNADTVSYFFDPTGVTVNLATGKASDGFGGTDTLSGFEIVTGSLFDDTITGDARANTLNGLAGKDTLNGGAGSDVLAGGDGADTFAFSDALNAKNNVDTLADFVSGTDRITLAQSVFTALSVGKLASNAFVQAAAAMTTKQHIVYNAATGDVFYDADGSGAGAAIAFAKVTPKQTLVAADFKVV